MTGEVRELEKPWVGPAEIDWMAGDLTVTVGADVVLRDLQEKLATNGQWVPGEGDWAWTVGRLIAENTTGPLRLGFGGWRDRVLGVQFTNGLGELITAGGRTVKNVAGYDLTKFMVGGRGVFGSIVTVTMRTYRRPEAAAGALFDHREGLVGELMGSALRPQWMMWTHRGLEVGYLGDQRAIEFYVERVRGAGAKQVSRRSLEEDVAYRARVWDQTGEARFRAAVPPARVMDFVTAAGCDDWAGDAAFGLVVGRSTDVERVRQAARGVGGSVYWLDRPAASAGYGDIEKRVLRRLKQALDPEGRLAPLEFE